MASVAMVEAISLALSWEMQNDDSVVVLGEDVGINGGVFRATSGLTEKFGDQRVIDTPLAETMIAGLAVGMSTQGMRPVIEAQFMGFIYPMVEQIICHASRMRHRTRGRLSCPLPRVTQTPATRVMSSCICACAERCTSSLFRTATFPGCFMRLVGSQTHKKGEHNNKAENRNDCLGCFLHNPSSKKYLFC